MVSDDIALDSRLDLFGEENSGARRPAAFRLVAVGQTYCDRAGIMVDRLEIGRGVITAIMGRSGSGKSTLLNLLGGMLDAEASGVDRHFTAEISTGSGVIVTQDILKDGWKGHTDAIGFVFQHPFLLRHAQGWENLAMSIASAGRRADRAEIEKFWTEQLRMSPDKAALRARELSGGMQQRLALGRALIRAPQIILADEPTANLDRSIGGEIITRICDWQRAGGGARTVIIVTHDVDLAARYADELVILDPAVVDPNGVQTDPGRLLGEPGFWPQPNPKNAEVIDLWMKGDLAGAEKLRGLRGSRDAEPASYAPPTVPDGAVVTPRAPSSAVSSSSISPISVWIRLGIAAVLSNQAEVVTTPLRRFLSVVNAILCVAALASMIGCAIFGSETVQLIGRALAPVVAPFALLAFFQRIAWNVVLRVIIFTILTTIAIVAVEGGTIVSAFTESQLNRPDLQPLVVFSGSATSLTPSVVDDLQKKFEEAELVQHATKGEDHSVFGRTSTGAVPMFLPPQSTSNAPPDCEKGGTSFFARGAVLGVNPAEPFLANIEWLPIDSQDINENTTNWLKGTGTQVAPSLGDGSDRPAVYLLEEFVRRNLRTATKQPMPRWICIGDQLDGEISAFRPYQIAAIVRSIPVADRRQHDVVASCDIGRRSRGGDQRDCDDPDFIYDQAAIRLSLGSLRIKQLRFVKELADRGKIQTESGFQKIQQASIAAGVIASIGGWFITLTAALAAIITLLTVVQFIEENRRPLAVARAFGANFRSVAAMIGVSLAFPCIIALLMGAIFAMTAAPFAIKLAPTLFQIGEQVGVSHAGAFVTVALGGIGIIGFVYVGVLGDWWWRKSKSLASELQEVG